MIEINQGISGSGYVFGYDHARCNFIEWAMEGDEIVVVKVENDSQVDKCGSVRETMKAARKIAAEQSRLPNGELRRAIRSAVAANA